MAHEPRTQTELVPSAQRIQSTWVSIRRTELRPFQFGLWHSLLLITCCAFLLSVARGFFNSSQYEQSVALRIQQVGGVVTWERSLLRGSDRIAAVSFINRRFDAALLQDIIELPYLTDLHLNNCRLFDVDILQLKPPERLTRIQLDNNPISDVAVAHIATFPNLEAVDLNSCPVTDASLRSLSLAPNLWQIRMDDTNVTDAGLQKLSKSTGLRILGLKGTKVTDAGLRYLHNHDQLIRLELAGSDVSEDGVATLNNILPKKPASLK